MGLFDWLRMPTSALEAPYRALGFEVHDGPAPRAETVGDMAVPVGGILEVLDPRTGRGLQFELISIEAAKGDKAVARFIARKTLPRDTIEHFHA